MGVDAPQFVGCSLNPASAPADTDSSRSHEDLLDIAPALGRTLCIHHGRGDYLDLTAQRVPR